MIGLKRALLGAVFALVSITAQAQNNYPSVGGATVPTSVFMCLNSSGQAVPMFDAAGTWQCSGATIPVAFDSSLLATAAKQDTTNTDLGPPGATACATDTGSCSINALLQRLAQRLTTLITGPLPVDTELATAVVAGDTMANPTTAPVIADNAIWDGTQWVRWKQAPGAVGVPSVNIEGTKATYSAMYTAVAITAAGNVLQIQGSGTKTVRVTQIKISGSLTTGASGNIWAFKTSTASSGGSPVTATASGGGIAKYDSASGAVTAALTAWSTPPSGTGTLIGGITEERYFAAAPTAPPSPTAKFEFGTRNQQAVVLRGTSEYLQLYTDGFASYTGANFTISVEWTEE